MRIPCEGLGCIACESLSLYVGVLTPLEGLRPDARKCPCGGVSPVCNEVPVGGVALCGGSLLHLVRLSA